MGVWQRLGVVDFTVMSLISEERSTKKAKYINKDARGSQWPDVARDRLLVKMEGHKK